MSGINEYTALCLQGDTKVLGAKAVNGAFEVLDSGNTGHVVTQSTNAVLSSAVKKFGSSSGNLSTDGAYFSVADSANWDFGTGQFCIEGWFNLSSGSSGVRELICTTDYATGGAGFTLVCNNTNTYFYAMYSGLWALSLTSNSTPTRDQFVHVAVTRDASSNLKLFLDGVDVTATSNGGGTNITGSPRPIWIGKENGSVAGRGIRGYVDEVRISNTARYTENFTPSKTAFTSDANTLLLLHMDTQDESGDGGSGTYHIPAFTAVTLDTMLTTFLDHGSGKNAITKAGTATYQTATTKVWNASPTFDGNSDWLTVDGLITTLATATVGSMSAWIYLDSDNADANVIFSCDRDNASNPSTFFVVAADMRTEVDHLWAVLSTGTGATQWQWTGADGQLDALVGTWVHVAVVQDGTSPKFYLNGNDVTAGGTWVTSTDKTKWWKAVITDATYKCDSYNIGVEEYGGTDYYHFNGKIADARISTSEWTSANITTLYNSGSGTTSAIGDEVFWLRGTGAFGDGETMFKFNGSSSKITIPDSDDWDVVSDNDKIVTIDGIVQFTDHVGVEDIIGQDDAAQNYWLLTHIHGTGLFFGYRNTAGSLGASDTGAEITDTSKHHLAIVIKGTGSSKNIGVYLDGVQTIWIDDADNLTFAAPLWFGERNSGGTNWFDGYMGAWRIQNNNYFNASPNSGKTDTISIPDAYYTVDSPTPPAESAENAIMFGSLV